MQPKTKSLLVGILLGAGGTLLLLFGIALAFAYAGLYDVAASRDHTAGVRWFLDSTKQASVRSRVDQAGEAADPSMATLADAGSAFKSMCEHCHGGPGVDPADWSRGMRPRPPDLVEAARQWDAAEVEWIIRHGLKFTGMPSFAQGHDDAALRELAVFVTRLPAMTPADYAALGDAGEHRHDDGHAHPGHADAGRTQAEDAEAPPAHPDDGHAH